MLLARDELGLAELLPNSSAEPNRSVRLFLSDDLSRTFESIFFCQIGSMTYHPYTWAVKYYHDPHFSVSSDIYHVRSFNVSINRVE